MRRQVHLQPQPPTSRVAGTPTPTVSTHRNQENRKSSSKRQSFSPQAATLPPQIYLRKASQPNDMITCSACRIEFLREEGQTGESDIRFDVFCPECGSGVVPDGDAEEIRRQRDVQKHVINDIQELAEETQTPQGPQHSIEYLRDRLEQILEDIDIELAHRNSE